MTRTDARAPEPQPSAERRKGRFPSGDTTCAAWHLSFLRLHLVNGANDVR
jgi:hypothetical protein